MFEMPPIWGINLIVEGLLAAVGVRAAAVVAEMYDDAPNLSLRWRILNLFGTFPDQPRPKGCAGLPYPVGN